MKTTVEIPEALFREAKELARERNWTMRMVLEESLRAYLHAAPRTKDEVEVLAHTTFGSPGGPGTSLSWPEIRDMIYGMPPERA